MKSRVREVGGHLPASTVRIGAGPDRPEQMVQGRLPDRERQRSISVVPVEPIVSALQVSGHRHLHRFVPGTGDLKEGLVLTIETDFPVIHPPGGEHR